MRFLLLCSAQIFCLHGSIIRSSLEGTRFAPILYRNKKKKEKQEGRIGWGDVGSEDCLFCQEIWRLQGKETQLFVYCVLPGFIFASFFFSSFLSVSNDHLGLTEQIISEFLSRLHFVLALSLMNGWMMKWIQGSAAQDSGSICLSHRCSCYSL